MFRCALFLILLPFVIAFEPVTFKGCGQMKGCLRHPRCTDNAESCLFGATWKKISVDGIDYIEFELLGVTPESRGFITLAFSEDQITANQGQGDDGVVGCAHNAYGDEDASIYIQAAYNEPKDGKNKFIRDTDEDFLIKTGDNLGGKYFPNDRTLQCRFRRIVTPKSNVDKLKDLNPTKNYFLLLSRGDALDSNGFGNAMPGGVVFSQQPVAVTSVTYGSMTGYLGNGTPLAKAHGALMVLAWVFCSSVGIILARYYKDVWPNSGVMGERVWFQAHRILQGFCVALTLLGFILILAYCRGWSQVFSWPHYMHPILGIIVIILTILNPLLALCRCHPAHERRPYFNWAHFVIGTVAYIMSVPTMMLGFRMPAAGVHLAALDYPMTILIFFVLFQFIVEISLEIHGCIYYRRNKNKRHAFEIALDQYTAANRVGSGQIHKPEEPEPSGRMFKYFMIGLHATVSSLVAVLLIIIIAVN